jgi:hypothetical protein
VPNPEQAPPEQAPPEQAPASPPEQGGPLPLVTCSYKAYEPVMGVAVRITVGRPRFFRHPYEYVSELAPFGIFKTPEFDGVKVPGP